MEGRNRAAAMSSAGQLITTCVTCVLYPYFRKGTVWSVHMAALRPNQGPALGCELQIPNKCMDGGGRS